MTKPTKREIGIHLESLGFISQELIEDWSEAIAFKSFLIMPEYPNGGMTALSIKDIASERSWSLPTGLGKHCPEWMKNFDYDQEEEAIAWLKDEIKHFEEAIAS
jgi:hypothetical protein